MYPDLDSKTLNFSLGFSSLSDEASLSESSFAESLLVLLPSVSFFFFSSFFFAFSAWASWYLTALSYYSFKSLNSKVSSNSSSSVFYSEPTAAL